MNFASVYAGKRILVTGHTGFKGSWLCEWLLRLGAEVHGIALAPETKPALFDQLDLANRVNHRVIDVRDARAIRKAVADCQPDFVFHLAAQALVRRSYAQPLPTFETNVLGTANVLEAVRQATQACVVLVITTDKCYENREWVHSYREEDALGGNDPYSSSKAAAELVVSAYRWSYFRAETSSVRLASVRAGNVIGGGDWAEDRIVPDCIRALAAGRPIAVRNPHARRPWQHVLEPLSGYLHLGSLLARSKNAAEIERLTSAFNFGPTLHSNRNVQTLVTEVLISWPGTWENRSSGHAVHEANLLNLSIDKAYHTLQWRPVWSFEQTVAHTVIWYRSQIEGVAARALVQDQIAAYVRDAKQAALVWAH